MPRTTATSPPEARSPATTLSWSGALAVGATVTVTYSVTVNDPRPVTACSTNAVVRRPPEASAIRTRVHRRARRCRRSPSPRPPATTAMPGDVVTYTVTVTNTGDVAYTDAAPASFTDDLSGVLDDATYNDDASAGASVTGTTLTWSGALAAGEAIEVTYSVTVNDPITGDQDLLNTVVPTAPGGTCGRRAAAPPPRRSRRSRSTRSVSAATSTLPGDTVTYTVTVTNTSSVAYTDTDTGVLPRRPVRCARRCGLQRRRVDRSDGHRQRPSPGPAHLAAGASLDITYSVTVDDPVTGDFVLRNAVSPTGPGGSCATSVRRSLRSAPSMWSSRPTAPRSSRVRP